jgi:glycosyltransferase involved in cell wall biosynthesis
VEQRASELEVFILTYNRAALLRETLISLCSQTAEGFSIVVLDNGSTDDTVDVVASFAASRVTLARSEINLGVQGNLDRAKNLASRKWVMVFHDDDLMHPAYIEDALAEASRYPDVAMVASGLSFENAPTNVAWDQFDKTKARYCGSASALAGLMYAGFPLHFGSAIYRTELFKALRWEFDKYGKICDRPFLLNIAAHGAVIVLENPYVRYRCHAGQDSATDSNGPYIKELFALHHLYLSLLGRNLLSRSARIFIYCNYQYLCDEYERISPVEKAALTRLQYVRLALAQGASTYPAMIYGRAIRPAVRGFRYLARAVRNGVPFSRFRSTDV